MSKDKRQMRLGAILMEAGHHVAAWRHPRAEAHRVTDVRFYQELAQLAERGKMDLVFFADTLGVPNYSSFFDHNITIRLEPLTLLAALSAVTRHIGLAATATTTYNEPFHIARLFSSLDHISGGRVGWNVVTSALADESLNFGRDTHMAHAKRYDRAKEFVEVVTGLWDSWEDDAFLIDQAQGRFADSGKLHTLNHQGEHFAVRGPLNISRSPQGYPVIIQAGSSEEGQELAAQTAEVVFTAQPTLARAQHFYASLKGKLAAYGRAEDELLIMPGVFPIIGRTAQEAQSKLDELQELIHPAVGLDVLSRKLGHDISGYPLDEPLPDLPESNGDKSRNHLLLDMARQEGLTLRQLYMRVAGSRGHQTVVGTPEQVADHLEEWFVQHGADGFNVMAPYLPGGLEDFVNLVIPELQRRGLFRTEYEGATLREHLGLSRPANRHAR
ncbi:LLM class flavin-dependent oxidoreductase [Paenibacillus filicis]|uniref:LLM class flavin-dependent oxidoreductase n=1 Tax=Paenibacillus filicis TaxID=669464 RepID=A0ABU9DJQ9_9BACL